MSEKTADLRATLKAGTGFDSPWLTVDAATPEELEFKLQALANGTALASLVEAANALKAANNAAPLAPQGQEAQAAPVQQQTTPAGWGQSAPETAPTWAAQQQAPAAPAQPAGSRLHPEGKTCPCGNVLNFKQVNRKSDGKQFSFWECPARTGSKDTQHVSEFAN